MVIRTLFCLIIISIFSAPVPALQEGKGTVPSFTLWLMPAQPAEENTPVVGPQVEEQIAQFNLEFGDNSPVTVVNTTDSWLRAQLRVWNQEFAGPSWPIVKGQTETLRVIAKFARDNHIHINVRFLNWGSAFKELEDAAIKKRQGKSSAGGPPPDIAQVGSTWVAYFASNGLLIPYPPPSEGDGLSFRSVSGMNRASILYTVDVRLLFYWKRNRLAPPTATPFELKSESWEAIIKSLEGRVLESGESQNPPMVIPTGLTLNLLHDYAPLVWAGGGEFLHEDALRTYVDLTTKAALRIPEYLARNTAVTDANGLKHPLITFPEMSTEEATKHFLDGDFSAIQKPAGFIRRWYEKFEKDMAEDVSLGKGQKEPTVFWDYAGVAVPPKPFKGGSDLIVLNDTQHKEQAVELARFLVSDESYTGIIARFEGYLPAQVPDIGVKHLIESLQINPAASQKVVPSVDADGLKRNYSDLINQVILNGEEYPELASFPIDVESRESLEAFQILLRRIGEGDRDGVAAGNIKEAAKKAEHVINLRIDWLTKAEETLPYVLIVGLVLAIIAWVFAKREAKHNEREAKSEQARAESLRERADLLQQVRKVRGFASSTLAIVDTVHNGILSSPYFNGEVGTRDAEKALIIAAGLQGWRRGHDDRNFERGRLETVIWRAIILAIESVDTPLVFRLWEQKGCPPAADFLEKEYLVRRAPEYNENDAPFYFNVDCPQDKLVSMPFMLEQLLVCLIQNSIKAVWEEDGEEHSYSADRYCREIAITYDADSNTLSVLNQGYPLGEDLRQTLNEAKDITDFENRVDLLLRGDKRNRPGVGLVEAYCIAKQLYGGLRIDPNKPKVSIILSGDCLRHSYEDSDC